MFEATFPLADEPPATPFLTRANAVIRPDANASADTTISRLTPRLLGWYARNARELPWRPTRDPYAIWISEVMLQQTQVKTVVPYYQRWMQQFPTVDALARAPLTNVLRFWAGLGYYRRARNLHSAARLVMTRFQGRFPDDLQAALTLPGVGRYTAGAICSIAFNQPTPILDGNIIRVLTRLFAIPGDPRTGSVNRQLWQLAERWVQHAALSSTRPCATLNQSLMELGALVCTPQNPECLRCPLQAECRARLCASPTSFPRTPARPTTTTRRYAVFIVRHHSSFLVHRQDADTWNAGLWGFPAIEFHEQRPRPRTLLHRLLKVRASDLRHLGEVRHSITRYRLRLDIYAAEVTSRSPTQNKDSRWCRAPTLGKLPLQTAHRRILHLLLDRRR